MTEQMNRVLTNAGASIAPHTWLLMALFVSYSNTNTNITIYTRPAVRYQINHHYAGERAWKPGGDGDKSQTTYPKCDVTIVTLYRQPNKPVPTKSSRLNLTTTGATVSPSWL